jgi:hypothetical protein
MHHLGITLPVTAIEEAEHFLLEFLAVFLYIFAYLLIFDRKYGELDTTYLVC